MLHKYKKNATILIKKKLEIFNMVYILNSAA